MIPGQIGKYDDTYNSRAFGDNIQKWGINTILIESGGYTNDPDREYARKLNFCMLIRAFQAIYLREYENQTLEEYQSVPFNVKENIFDLLVRNAVIEKNGKKFKVDLGINREEVSYNDYREQYFVGTIIEIGDLSNFNGYKEFDVNGCMVMPGKIYPNKFHSKEELQSAEYGKILESGCTSVVVGKKSTLEEFSPGPVNYIKIESTTSASDIIPGAPANLIVLDNKKVVQTIVNGFLVSFNEPDFGVANGVIF